MSGVFWEAEKQPDIVEAVSGYTFSSINLMVAIPMFLIDSVCSLVLALVSLACLLLTTCHGYATLALSTISEALGLQDLDLEFTDYLLPAFCLFNLVLSYYLVGPKSGGSWPRVLSRSVYYSSCVLLMVTFLSYTGFEDTSVYPQMGLLMMSVQFIMLALQGLVKEFSNYACEPPKTELSSTIDMFLGLVGMESVFFLAIAAFGFPKFGGDDDKVSYICIVPMTALWLLFCDAQRKKSSAPTPAPVSVANGKAVPVAESTVIEEPEAPVIEEPEAPVIEEPEPAVIEEPEAPVIEEPEPAVKEEPEILEEEVKGIEGVHRLLSKEPEAEEEASIEEVADESTISEPETKEEIDDSEEGNKTITEIVDEIEEQIEDIVEQIGSSVEAVVEKAKEVTEDMTDSVDKETAQVISLFSPLFNSVYCLISLITTTISTIITPIVSQITKTINAIVSVPWFLIFLFVFCNGSQVVLVHCWLHLTGNNPLSYLLPLTTLVTPLVLNKAKIAQPWRGLLGDLNGLAFVGIQYQLVTMSSPEE